MWPGLGQTGWKPRLFFSCECSHFTGRPGFFLCPCLSKELCLFGKQRNFSLGEQWIKSSALKQYEKYYNHYNTHFLLISSERHTTKVKTFMLDMMAPLLSEADTVSQELLDILLLNIVEPHKTQNRQAYNLAKELLERTCNAIEPYVQAVSLCCTKRFTKAAVTNSIVILDGTVFAL